MLAADIPRCVKERRNSITSSARESMKHEGGLRDQ
jgi:hypothetical protein